FQLRMDRVLWLGLWVASLVVLAISLMASFSRGDSRQFVVGPNSSSSERASQSPGAALELNSRPGVTSTPSVQQQPPPACATDGSRECQCNDFATQPAVRLLLDCAEICQTCANFMLPNSPLHAITCAACAGICERCAVECERFAGDMQMEACARMCRTCAESCKEMAATGTLLGDRGTLPAQQWR